MEDKVIGVDIGGTNVRVGLINQNLKVEKRETVLTSTCHHERDFFQQIRKMIEQVDPDKEAKKVGIVLPVPWKEKMERFRDVTNLSLLENMSVKTVESYFPEYDLYFENDVNAIALLEVNCGAAKNAENAIYITVSTGIGSGLILNKEIFHGSHGYAGEIGSMIISDENRNHFALYKGTLESLCSGKALEEESVNLFGSGATAKCLFEEYHIGHPGAIQVIESWVDYFSSAVASLMQIINPDVFVLGGAVLLHNSWLIEKLTKSTRNKVFEQLKDKVKLVISAYGHDAGMIGAGYLAMKTNNKGEGKDGELKSSFGGSR